MPPFRFAMIQMAVGAVKLDNMTKIKKLVSEAAQNGAKVIALPEMCNIPTSHENYVANAETIPGFSSEVFSQTAQENDAYLIAGSIPERNSDGRLYNTCTIFNPQGELVGKHRKVHLFDIDIPGKVTFQESLTLTAGSSLTTFDTPYCKIGVGICYDIRFAELAQIYSQQGCQLLVYPGAFNMTTGPAHWELLIRARAIDNQLYVAAVSPARDETHTYIAWGHSTLVNPWGQVVAKAEVNEAIIYSDIDTNYVDEVRQQIPITKQRRKDLYKVEHLGPHDG